MMKPTNIALFVGNDIYSLLTYQELIRKSERSNVTFTLFMPRTNIISPSIDSYLKKMLLLERKIISDVVFDFIDNNPDAKGIALSHKGFSTKHDVDLNLDIDDINDPSFIDNLSSYDGVISIRCYQKFSSEYMRVFSSDDKFLWNLHPGDLPKYRGVMTLFRAMCNEEVEYGITLHEMNEDWDSGPIVDKCFSKLSYSKSYLENMIDAGFVSGKFIADKVRELQTKSELKSSPQGEYKYWTFPTSEELNFSKSLGVSLFDTQRNIDEYFQLFIGDETLRASFEDKCLSYIDGMS